MPSPPLEEFHIGWICALPIEVAAAKEILDENFGILEEQDCSDTNSYTLGRIGKHNVVIASLGQYGIVSGATVAVNMMRTFSRSLRIGLMVGVGAGIPSTSYDIRLGDVVVSYPDKTCGGVLQYDTGKIIDDGKLLRTGSLNSPPRSLLAAVTNMRAAALTDNPSYPEYIEKAIQRNGRTLRSFGRPGASTDRLFKIGYAHPAAGGTLTCDACPPEWEETRKAREEMDPHIHYGIIASGNAVVKHAASRERFRLETGALCFEMEAAGLMQDFPCIVIRGVCDYADSHKNKQWQGYAALAAASYAKELLSYVPAAAVRRENLAAEKCNEIIDELKEVNKSLGIAALQQYGYHRENMALVSSKEQQECHRAFKTSTYEQYKNINPNRAEGTCRWILESSQYRSWLESSNHDLLWISADPGCGKSVLAKSLVDEDLVASTSTPVSVCYFFFKDNDEQNSLATALCAILHQLFGIQPDLLRHALPSWRKNSTKIQKEVNELWRILEAIIADTTFNDTVCVLDALDECRPSDRIQLTRKLESFYSQSRSMSRQNWFKFLITCRPYTEIQEGFRTVTQLCPHIHIRGETENDQIHKEISLVVKIQVAELSKSLRLPLYIRKRLEEQLLLMEHRTYLWLYLAMDDIRTGFQHSLQPEEESIQLIPNSVSAAYAKILRRVPLDKVSDVRTILQIIVAARRPLTIQEMAMALGIAKMSSSQCSQSPSRIGLNLDGLDEKIRQLCGLFVFINNSKIYLIHQTAREFLTDIGSRSNDLDWSFKRSETDRLMGVICVKYLLLTDTVDNSPQTNVDVYGRKEDADSEYSGNTDRHIFLDYAAKNWSLHFREGCVGNDDAIVPLAAKLCDPTSTAYTVWFKVYQRTRSHIMTPGACTSLVLAAYFGHTAVVRLLLHQGADTESKDAKYGWTPLWWATVNRYAAVICLLLDNGANTEPKDRDHGLTPLLLASKQGQPAIVKLLLDKSADINSKDSKYGRTALSWAVMNGSTSIVELLLSKGAKVNMKDCDQGQTPLSLAAAKGYEAVVNLILGVADVHVDTKDQNGETPLSWAASNGHFAVAELLIATGNADVNVKGAYRRTPLLLAACNGHIAVVKLLIDKGNADINAADEGGCTPLWLAAQNGNVDIVQLLLHAGGVNVNAKDTFGGTALSRAAENGHAVVLKLLLDAGNIDVDSKDVNGWTALWWAAENTHEAIVEQLLHTGKAHADVKDAYGRTPLWWAAQNGHATIVKLLLGVGGADVNAKDVYGRIPLWGAARNGHEAVVKLLLDTDMVDINAEDADGRTPLWAAKNRHEAVVKLLCDGGTANSTPDSRDIWTPIWDTAGRHYQSQITWAVRNGFEALVRSTLPRVRKRDINMLVDGGGTMLWWAARNGHDAVVKLFLRIDNADVNAIGKYGGTPLYWAARNGHEMVVKLLLDTQKADVDAKDVDGRTAHWWAVENGHGAVVKLLQSNRSFFRVDTS